MTSKTKVRETRRVGRHRRIRKKLVGTSSQPRLCVHRSLKNFYAQVIDDTTGKVLFGHSTLNRELRKKIKNGGNLEAARQLGEAMAADAKKKGILRVRFDRGGYIFHGRVKAFAQAAREGGFEF